MGDDELTELKKRVAQLEREKAALEKQVSDRSELTGSAGIQSETIQAENVVSGVQFQNQYFAPKDPSDPVSLRQAYLNRVFCHAGILPLEGIDPTAKSCGADDQLNLSGVYTALLTLEAQKEKEESERFFDRERRVSALKLLNQHRHMVLLGDPGSGKSTFVNFVALCLAGENLGRRDADLALLTRPLPDKDGDDAKESQPWDHGPLLPVRVILRDFAARGFPKNQGCARDLLDFLEAELKSAALDGFISHLERELREHGGLLMLDGLDEVSEARDRRIRIKAMVGDFISAFPKCRVLVTSRTYAYQNQNWRIPGLHEAVLAPFSKGQIIRFILRWYAHLAGVRGWTRQNAAGKAEHLKQAVLGSQRLRDLAQRPLLLTLMASLHFWRGGSLPEKREELYAESVELLLDRWESEKIIRDANGNPISVEPSLAEFLKADRERIRWLLDELAYQAHASQPELQGTADIAEKDLVHGLFALSTDETAINEKKLIAFLNFRAGLLIPRGVGVYTFPHRSFQEYLAACYLTNADYPETVAELARTDPERWREVALLAGAKAAGGASAMIWSLTDALCFRSPEDPAAELADDWGALLAGRFLAETAALDKVSARNQTKLARVRGSLVKVLEGETLPAIERALAGRSLAVLGDPRKEVITPEHMEFCLVPAGPFVMGSDEGPDDEKPAHTNEHLNYDYWISRNPITNAQFEAFVKAGGYGQRRYWEAAEEAGYWESGGFKGRGDDERRSRPHDFGSRFHLANQPVVEVSWYEVLAFTQWLSEQWREQGILDENWRVCLPSEAEWEKAAKGGIEIPKAPVWRQARDKAWSSAKITEFEENSDRKYPWGDTPDTEKANYDDTGIGAPSALGCFLSGANPYGCLDMAGNVWEWTRSLWGRDFTKPAFTYPYGDIKNRENILAKSKIFRVLRGGSFDYDSDDMRCACRYRHYPVSRSDLRGFRCVCAPNL